MSFDEKFVEKQLQKRTDDAELILNNPRKLNRILQRSEKKLKRIPKIGKKLSYIPVFIELITDFIHKEYLDIPVGTIIGVIVAVAYFVLPFDVVPDFLPFADMLTMPH